MAADMAQSAARAAMGQEAAPPAPIARTIDDYLKIGISLLAGLAVILGLVSFIRHEAKRAALSGIALGGMAIGFQLFTWGIMMLAGTLVIMALVYAMRDAFGDMFGGLLGG
jgi:formate-dependent nitrite reductase membrane component NrfD